MKKPSKNTLVFLPGWGFKSSIWENIAHSFDNYSILLLDLPIIAEKSSLSSTHLEFILNQLHAQIPLSSTLIAWSLGGLIAMYLCHLHPNHYQRLILTNSTPKFSSTISWPGISPLIENNFSKYLSDFDYLIKRFVKIIQYPYTNKFHQYFLVKHFYKNNPMLLTNLVSYLQLLFNQDARDIYRQLTIPITHLFGEQDAIIPIAVVNPLKKLNRLAKIHSIPEAGHIPFLTHPSIFIQYIQDSL